MKKNDRTLYYIFLSLGLVMIFISAVIYYYQRHSIGNVIHTTGIIVDTQQRKPNPYRRNSVSRNAKEGANKQVISSQADSLIKISRIWADFFPA
ncbi:hypothetical protein AB8R78_26300, partial [Klebsiella pneumoniae]